MKRTVLLVMLFSFNTKYLLAQTKHALIVAIGNYPDPDKNGWPVISSMNDVPLIKNALILNQHFSEKNVQVLTDSQATKTGIINALDKLISAVNKGDVVVIHFSSHGEQIEDNNGDEIDGLDETIVPYGAVISDDKDKFNQLADGYIRDDLFGDKVIQLRNKLGKEGDLLVIIDACHSGTGTRGVPVAKVRGGKPAMVSNKFNARKIPDVADTSVFKENTGTKLNPDASRFVLISGAQAREINSECLDDNKNPVGSLSYAFSKAISSLEGTITYRGLFSMIENIMRQKAPKQKPVLEGDGIDWKLFGGNYEKQQLYFSINQSQSKNNQVVLNAGFVSGINVGSTINFYETGTTSTTGKKPLNSGKVISANSFTATVKLDSLDDNLVARNPYAFISELAYGTGKLKLDMQNVRSVTSMVKNGLKDFPLVEFDQACELFLDTSGSVKNWALKYPNSGNIFQDGFTFSGNEDISSLKDALKRFNRYRYLKGLSLNETGLTAIVQLVFLDDKGNIDSMKQMARTPFGRLELKEGDQVYLRITNTGKKFYINIVDMQPDGQINPVMPNKGLKNKEGDPAPLTVEDCMLLRNETRNIPIDIAPPYGDETFKIFLSSSALDLEDILTSTDEKEALGKRGILNGLEKIFVNSNSNELGKRGANIKVNSDQNGTVFSLNFQILPK